MNLIHGILLSAAVGAAGVLISNIIPVGSVALAIIIGTIVGNTINLHNKYEMGITYSEKTLLSFAIAFMGINLDFVILSDLGIKSILLIVVALAATLLFALFIAKVLKFDKDFALILGIGNGVCGSAAIAATKDIVGLDKQKAGLAVAIVNFLGTIGIFLLPLIGTFILGLSDIDAGILIGNTLQAVGQVVASGFSMGDSAGQSATIVKMGRVLMLTPIVLILIYYVAKKRTNDDSKDKGKNNIPLFIIGFIFFSILSSLGILPQAAVDSISWVSHTLLLVAMAAIGLKINFKTIKQSGSGAFAVASYIFIFQILFSSLVLIFLF
ncbi:MAG: putative sulfate exporter family transporter [Campylobacterota bacterium]|nr:putative sulfate exporter family transporter [Campylobacterota bacterium]